MQGEIDHPLRVRMVRVYRNILQKRVLFVEFKHRAGAVNYERRVDATDETDFKQYSQTLDILTAIYTHNGRFLGKDERF